MVSDAQQVMAEQAWLIVPSGLTLGLVIFSLILLSDAVRDATASNRGRITSALPKPAVAIGPAGDGRGTDLPLRIPVAINGRALHPCRSLPRHPVFLQQPQPDRSPRPETPGGHPSPRAHRS
jgi:hypothetical protein